MTERSSLTGARVLLVQPAFDRARTSGLVRRALTPIPPLGLAALAASLRAAGHRVRVIDQVLAGIGAAQIADAAAALGADLVGLSVLTPSMPVVEDLVGRLRRRLPPAAKVVLGNAHAAVFGEQLVRSGLCDVAVRGEGERTLVELAETVARGDGDLGPIDGLTWRDGGGDGEVRVNAPREPVADLASLPRPQWRGIDPRGYPVSPVFLIDGPMVPIAHGRGCRQRCTFCAQNLLGPGLRQRPVGDTVDEMAQLLRDRGLRRFLFVDASFPADDETAFAFAEELHRRGLARAVRWISEVRPDALGRRALATLAGAGLHMLAVGYDCGDDEILARHRKGYTIEDCHRCADSARAARVLTFGMFVIGLPGETHATVEATVRLALRLDPTVAKVNRFVPFPGSALFEDLGGTAWAADLPPETMSAWSTADAEPYRPEGFTPGELRRIQRRAMARFYLRPRKLAQLTRLGHSSIPQAMVGSMRTRPLTDKT